MRENLSKASPPRKKSKMIIEENEEFQNSPFPLNPQSKTSPNKLDLNKNNNYDRTYRSMAEASLVMNKNRSYISQKINKGIYENENFIWKLL